MANRMFSHNTSRTALVGVLSAGGLAVLWLACLSPSGRLGLNAVAGLFPMVAVMAAGSSAGYFCWAVISILGLILLPDKGMALIYLGLFGLYPVLKSRFEKGKGLVVGWCMKIAYFNVVFAVLWFGFRTMFLTALPGWLSSTLIWSVGNAVFIAYDIGLTRLIFGLFDRFISGRRG